MIKRIIRTVLCLVSFFTCILLAPHIVEASINEYESSVISAASSTFYYDGVFYVADSGYMAQLQAKLDSSDVDLTASDAQAAINKIYSSVAEGVEKGYVVAVNTGASGSTGDSGGSSSGGDSGNSGASGTGGQSATSGNSGSGNNVVDGGVISGDGGAAPVTGDGTSSDGSGTASDTVDEIPDGTVIANADGTYTIQGQEEAQLSDSDEVASQAERTDELQNEDNTGLVEAESPAASGKALYNLYLSGSGELYAAVGGGEDGIADFINELESFQPISGQFERYLNRIWYVILLCIILMILLFVMSAALRCGRWQRGTGIHAHTGEHKRRKALRTVAATVATVIASVSAAIGLLGAAFWISGHMQGDARALEEATGDQARLETYQTLKNTLRGYGDSYLFRLMLYGFLTLVIALFLVFMVQYFWHRGIRMIRYGLLAGGIATLIVTAVLYYTGLLTRVNIQPPYLYSYFAGYIQNGLLLTIVFAGILIMFSVVLYPLEHRIRKQANHD